MKFKRNGLYLEEICEILILTFGCLIYFIVDHAVKKSFIMFLGSFLLMLFIYTRDGGLLYDTVYCDEKEIKIVTHKKTTEISWNEVSKVERFVGRGGRMIGWRIVSVSGEEVYVCPSSFGTKKRFKKYMQSKLPHLKIE